MLEVRKHYLYEDGKPFFWLGDTAWLLLEKLTMEEAKVYLKNRKSLGYNVIQAILFYTLPNKEGIQSGMPVYDKETYSREYFTFVNEVIAYAKTQGIYMALLPTWGSFFKREVLNEENVVEFAEFLVKEFAHHDNLVWVLGGDVKGDINLKGFDNFGKALRERDTEHLITFHPFGRTLSARWFNDCKWLDFNMFQSGHRRYDQRLLRSWDDVTENYYGEDAWRYVVENFEYENSKPCLDGEPSYEGIVQGLLDKREDFWEAKDVRRYAYWSVFEGACGFTYGNNSIIQFYDPQKGPGAYGVRESWQEGLHSEGGAELQYLKQLMESVDFTAGCAHEDYLVSPQRERYHRISVFAGEDFLFAYDYSGDPFELSLESYKDKTMDVYWMNPQNGSMSYVETLTNIKSKLFRPTKRHEASNDWVLVIKKS